MEDLGQIDNLGLSRLGEPLLNDYYGSAVQREDVLKIAREIMQRHLAKLPSDTGKLKSTARITTPRVRHKYDSRFEAVYTIGGGRADYIVPLEAEHHYLDEVLREMGFYTGDVAHGPTGKVAPEVRAPKAAPREERRPVDRRLAQSFVTDDIPDKTVRRIAEGRVEGITQGEINAAKDELVRRAELEAGTNSGHAVQREERRPIYTMTDDEVRRRNLEGHLAANAAADTPERHAAVAEAEEAADVKYRAEAAAALRGSRLGSKASERKFQDVALQYKSDLLTGRDTSATQAALEEHNRAREAAGHDPIMFRWEPGGEKRPYR